MTRLADLRRRLDRIEAGRVEGAPTSIFTGYPVGDPTPEAALADWRAWVADGRASVRNGVLYVLAPVLTEEEWIAQHVTEH